MQVREPLQVRDFDVAPSSNEIAHSSSVFSERVALHFRFAHLPRDESVAREQSGAYFLRRNKLTSLLYDFGSCSASCSSHAKVSFAVLVLDLPPELIAIIVSYDTCVITGRRVCALEQKGFEKWNVTCLCAFNEADLAVAQGLEL